MLSNTDKSIDARDVSHLALLQFREHAEDVLVAGLAEETVDLCDGDRISTANAKARARARTERKRRKRMRRQQIK